MLAKLSQFSVVDENRNLSFLLLAQLVWFSAAVIHHLQGDTYSAFRDALLKTSSGTTNQSKAGECSILILAVTVAGIAFSAHQLWRVTPCGGVVPGSAQEWSSELKEAVLGGR